MGVTSTVRTFVAVFIFVDAHYLIEFPGWRSLWVQFECSERDPAADGPQRCLRAPYSKTLQPTPWLWVLCARPGSFQAGIARF